MFRPGRSCVRSASRETLKTIKRIGMSFVLIMTIFLSPIELLDNRLEGTINRRLNPTRFQINVDTKHEVHMKKLLLVLAAAGCFAAPLMAQGKINPTDPQPTCNMCPGTYIPLSELGAYTKKAIAEKLIDQQVRDIEIGKAHVGIGMVHRGKLDKPAPNSVAEHDLVSEVYHIVSGTATLVLGPDITNRQRRPGTLRTVIEFNGPGNHGSEIRNGKAYDLKPGDVVVIPAGTGHWFTKIHDYIDYFRVRSGADKGTPLRSEAQSKEYLSKPAPREQ